MKAITLTQPWATLVAIGAKKIETRGWPPYVPNGTVIAIHAAKGFGYLPEREIRDLCRREPFAAALDGIRFEDLPRGAIVALCTLKGCARITPANRPPLPEAAFGDYTPGRWAWHLENRLKLPQPYAIRGGQGLWTVKPADVAAIEKHVGIGSHA